MKIRFIDTDEKATKKEFFLAGLLIVFSILMVSSLLNFQQEHKETPNVKFSGYSGCIYDSYKELSYCNPIKDNDGNWKDVRTNPLEKYLKE